MSCARKYLKKGLGQKEAVVRAVDECIEKGILEDVLVKHRAEVEDMFLTTFDKKMYEEAIRQEGREELAEKCEELARKADEEKARADEEKARADSMEVELARLREENARLKGEKPQ